MHDCTRRPLLENATAPYHHISRSLVTKADWQRPAFDIRKRLVTRNVGNNTHLSDNSAMCVCVYKVFGRSYAGQKGLMRETDKTELTAAIWSHLCLCLTYSKVSSLILSPPKGPIYLLWTKMLYTVSVIKTGGNLRATMSKYSIDGLHMIKWTWILFGGKGPCYFLT